MTFKKLLPGLGLVTLIVAIASIAASQSKLAAMGASPLTLAIILGALLGNLRPGLTQHAWQPGLRFAQKTLLRVGVALYGFNLNLHQIAQVGLKGLLIDILMLTSTLAIGYWIGVRWLRMDKESALLISAGSAICGAAAIVATVSVLQMDEGERIKKAATAVATVVLFGTAAMFLYPVLFVWLGGSHELFGLYIGSTVHEVAQVVAIGNTIGGVTAHNALIVKMIRVLMLVPFLLGLSYRIARKSGEKAGGSISVPWFALIFVGFACINSAITLPAILLASLQQAGILSLTFAMAAFGMETTFGLMRKAGLQPLLLGGILFAYLVLMGGWVNFGLA